MYCARPIDSPIFGFVHLVADESHKCSISIRSGLGDGVEVARSVHALGACS